MLDNASETVSVGSNEHSLASLDLGDNLLIPEGQGSGDGVLEALTSRQLSGLQACIAALLEAPGLLFSPDNRSPDPDSHGGLHPGLSAPTQSSPY